MKYSLLIFTDMTAFRNTLSYSLPMEQLLVPGAHFQVTGKHGIIVMRIPSPVSYLSYIRIQSRQGG